MLTILGLLTGLAGPLRDVINRITDLKIAQEQTKNNTEKAMYEQQIEEAHDRKAALVAEAGSRVNSVVRGFLTLGVVFYLNKVLLWDKVVGSLVGCSGPNPITGCHTFRTDDISPYMWGVITAVIAFYYLYDMAAKSRK